MWNNMSNVRREEKELDLKVRQVEALELITRRLNLLNERTNAISEILWDIYLTLEKPENKR